MLGFPVLYAFACRMLMMGIGLIRLPILTQALGAGQYGVWSLITVTVSLAVPFALLTLDMALVRHLAAENSVKTVRRGIWSAMLVISVSGSMLSGLVFALAPVLARTVFGDPLASEFIRQAAFLVLLDSLGRLSLAYYRLCSQHILRATLDLAHSILQSGLIIAAALCGFGLSGVIMGRIVGTVVFLILTACLIVVGTRGISIDLRGLRTYLRWGLPLILNPAILWIISVSDRYMIGGILGAEQVGKYSAAYRLGSYSSILLSAVTVVVYPALVATFEQEGRPNAASLLSRTLRYLMFFTVPLATGIATLSIPIIELLTTSEFREGAAVIPYVAYAHFLYCFYQIPIYVVHLVNKTYVTFRLLLLTALLNVAVNMILIPRIGIVGAALGTLVSYMVLAVATTMFALRNIPFNLELGFLAKALTASGVMAGIVWLLHAETVLDLLVAAAVGAGTYFAVLTALGGIRRADLQLLCSMVRRATGGLTTLGRQKEEDENERPS